MYYKLLETSAREKSEYNKRQRELSAERMKKVALLKKQR